MECVRKCEFQEFDGDMFYCRLYDRELSTVINVDKEPNTLSVIRCQSCANEELIGSNTKEEYIRKLKQRLGWLMDSFYSLKDDMEEEVTNIYRLVKEMEEDETVCISEVNRSRERIETSEDEEV